MTNGKSSLPAIGFIGLGNMGMPMSKRLIDAGYAVYGYDVDSKRRAAFASQGGTPVAAPAELHHLADILILLLPNSKIVGKVLFGQDGLFPADTDQSRISIMIDMSSSYPLDTQAYAKQLGGYGVRLIDAPVSGGVKKAITGELTIMIGGEKEVVDQIRPVLDHLGSNPFYLGNIGSGHTIKALNNYLSATHLYATIEAAAIIERMGIDPHIAMEAINKSTGRSGSSEYKMPAFILNQAYNSGFSLGLLAKDVTMSRDLITHYMKEDTLVEHVTHLLHKAKEELGEFADHTEVDRLVKKRLDLQ